MLTMFENNFITVTANKLINFYEENPFHFFTVLQYRYDSFCLMKLRDVIKLFD